MAIRNYKPTTNARRGMSTLVNDEITTNKPEKSLLVSKSNKAGRNNQGRITVRHQGGGEKENIVLLILKEINLILWEQLLLLNMILTEVQILL